MIHLNTNQSTAFKKETANPVTAALRVIPASVATDKKPKLLDDNLKTTMFFYIHSLSKGDHGVRSSFDGHIQTV